MKRNVVRLTTLVEDILNIARIENEVSAKEKVNLVEVLQDIAETLDFKQDKRIKVQISRKRIVSLTNREEIYAAIINIVANAIKYAPTGEILITLEQNNQGIFFCVTDNGPGIEKEHLPRIFERFYRPDKTRARESGGTGLGLSIVKNTIEKYNGTVGVESTIGKGSKFFFTLPN